MTNAEKRAMFRPLGERPTCLFCGCKLRGRPYFCSQICGFFFAEEAAKQGFRKYQGAIVLAARPNERTDETVAK